MLTDPKQHLLAELRRTGKHVPRLITGMEFAYKALDLFANTTEVYTDLVPELWEAVPVVVRDEFATMIRRATEPAYRFRTFRIGLPLTDDERQKDAEVRTPRVRAWAVEFCLLLDSLT